MFYEEPPEPHWGVWLGAFVITLCILVYLT